MTSIATWLNTAFAGFDYSILEFYHLLAEHAGFLLTPLLKLISLVGEKGIFCFAIGFLLMLFPKTRKAGVCTIMAVCVGALITNVTLKELVARPRPYATNELFDAWRVFVGQHTVSKHSFPSGHTTSAAAGMMGLALCIRKWKVVIPAALYALIMGASRNYLMVHYPTDVVAGLLVGAIAGAIAFGLTYLAFRIAEAHADKKLFRFILTADVRSLFHKKQA